MTFYLHLICKRNEEKNLLFFLIQSSYRQNADWYQCQHGKYIFFRTKRRMSNSSCTHQASSIYSTFVFIINTAICTQTSLRFIVSHIQYISYSFLSSPIAICLCRPNMSLFALLLTLDFFTSTYSLNRRDIYIRLSV